MAKLCPVCRVNMEQIYGTAETGLSVHIDKCPKCEGFWFDNQELFIISSEIAKKFDAEFTAQKIPDSKDRICPNCQLPLILLKDPELSKRVQIDICPKCLGLWLDKSEFLCYKEYQKEKIEKSKKADALRAAEALKKLGQTKEADSIWQFLMSDPYQAMAADEGIEFRNALKSILLNIVRFILENPR
ncbi:MAG: zf-TFIIB domain-containing protein [candidate division WOR-3 bacterium]